MGADMDLKWMNDGPRLKRIESSIRPLAPFVEQFSRVDNEYTDGTPEIIERVARELSLDYILRYDVSPDECQTQFGSEM